MPTTILCLSSYLKGQEFLRSAAATGARTFLLTVESLRDADWPRDVLADLLVMPSLADSAQVRNAVSWLARKEPITRIVALDEFDMELAAELREHLRIPGRGVTATRATRDKLVMRERAATAGIPVPEFTRVVHHGQLAEWLGTNPGPWVLKPRSQASAIGIRKLQAAEQLWPLLEQLGDEQSLHVLERFLPGHVYHADGIVVAGDVVFGEVHRYAQPPFDVMHSGGLFSSATLPRGCADARAIEEVLPSILHALDLRDGAFHVEFIRAHADGRFYFLEAAARVGGAHIAEMVEAATGINLWREWARLEVAQAHGQSYQVPESRRNHAGVLISLARQEWPDTSGFADPEIVWRLRKHHHAGLIVAAPDAERVEALLNDYMPRFQHEFQAAMPAPDRATN
jgi:biotin carboxylase